MFDRIIKFHQTHAKNARGIGQKFHVEASRFLTGVAANRAFHAEEDSAESPEDAAALANLNCNAAYPDIRHHPAFRPEWLDVMERLLERLDEQSNSDPNAERSGCFLEEAILTPGIYCSTPNPTKGKEFVLLFVDGRVAAAMVKEDGSIRLIPILRGVLWFPAPEWTAGLHLVRGVEEDAYLGPQSDDSGAAADAGLPTHDNGGDPA